MLRYLALFWNAASPGSAAAAGRLDRRLAETTPGMTALLFGSGLTVYTTAPSPGLQAYPLSSGRGVILGRVFRRGTEDEAIPLPDVFDSGLTELVCTRGGRGLLEHFWGQYVAFLHDRSSGETQIIRDPSGAIPCYLSSHAEVGAAFSHLQDHASLNPGTLSINWRFVIAKLIHPEPRSWETGLNEVTAVRPGEGATISGSREIRRDYHWGIVATAASTCVDDIEAAAAAASRCIRQCVSAWASTFDGVLLLLSGGLDSSIVLACLLQAPSRPRVTCLSYFDRSVGGDERAYARCAVNHAPERAGALLELIEQERDPCNTQLRFALDMPLSPAPVLCFGLLCTRQTEGRIAREKSPLFFTGLAGDAVFYRCRDASSAIDYVYHHGLGRRFARVALDAAYGEDSLWTVAASAIWHGLLSRHADSPFFQPREMPLLPADVLEAHMPHIERYCTPAWASSARTEALRAISPSKLRHIDRMASCIWHFRDPLESPGGPYWFAPLASQPVIELFSRIPLYVLTAGGEDRAVARRAFAGDLPAPLLARRTKGLQSRFHAEVLRQNIDLIRTIMLDGVLVKERLLDRPRVERLLTRTDCERAPELSDLVSTYIDVEIWLRSRQRHLGSTCSRWRAPSSLEGSING